ncbi:MAG: hypothetical protein AAF310_02165 [Myxococcota bacterium]
MINKKTTFTALLCMLFITISCSDKSDKNNTAPFGGTNPYGDGFSGFDPYGDGGRRNFQKSSIGDETKTASSVCSEKTITQEQCDAVADEIKEKADGGKKNSDLLTCVKKARTFCSLNLLDAAKNIKNKSARKIIFENVNYHDFQNSKSTEYIQQEDDADLAKILLEKLPFKSGSNKHLIKLFIDSKGDDKKQIALRETIAKKHRNSFLNKKDIEELFKVAGKDKKTDENILYIISNVGADKSYLWSKFIIEVPRGSDSQKRAFDELINYESIATLTKLDTIHELYDEAFKLIESKPYSKYSSDDKKFITNFLTVFYNMNKYSKGNKNPIYSIAKTSCNASVTCKRDVYDSLKTDVRSNQSAKTDKVFDAIDYRISGLAAP